MTSPSISVIIPAFNAEKYLAEALDSVLAQSLSAAEVILVDDGSTDGGPEVARRYASRVRYLRQENAGSAAARNRGVRAASGDWLSFLDADDLWERDKLNKQAAALAAAPSLDMVFAKVRQFLSEDLSVDEARRIELSQETIDGRVPGTMLIKRDSFLKVGYFGEGWKLGEFIDWYARARELGLREALLPEELMLRRLHASNFTRRNKGEHGDYLRILKASLDRRRGNT